jgi:pimeloyl-ACP methyl ester carboxylesterase
MTASSVLTKGPRPAAVIVGVTLCASVFGCASSGPLEIDLMPAPELIARGVLDPLPIENPETLVEYGGILYATDRAVDPEAGGRSAYLNRQGEVLRVGVADVDLSGGPLPWAEVRELSLKTDRDQEIPLRVIGVDEFGVLDLSLHPFTSPDVRDATTPEARQRFVDLVDTKVGQSRVKDVIIYVHGYKVEFEDPVLVASQLWHYLGYDGVFIAYSWPATPKRLAYFSDLETTQISARSLRVLVEFLDQHTEVDRIHVIGYSAGTRVVAGMVAQLAGRQCDTGPDRPGTRLSHVVLAGSDMDRGVFGTILIDGALDVVDRLTVYSSSVDQAMGLSRRVHFRPRLGERLEEDDLNAADIALLRSMDRLELIDVSNSANAEARNGHAYFRLSPWVSNDLLFALVSDLPAGDRALERSEDGVLWRFADDYPATVVEAGQRWRDRLEGAEESR